MPELISRRELLFAAVASSLLPGRLMANSSLLLANGQIKNDWSAFARQMSALASAEANGSVTQETVIKRGLNYLTQLDIDALEFKQAVEASYETGNRYWLWQRMLKQQYINGGILTIDSDQLVQLHDHPGSIGVLRIISGEVEVWQFDQEKESEQQDIVSLTRASHRTLRVGDIALLTPEKGNIHALRSISQQCSMLDFFIPPYKRNQRNWYEPLDKDWFNKAQLSCRKIPQHAYTEA